MRTKLQFLNAEDLMEGINLLADDLQIEVVSEDALVVVTAQKTDDNVLKVDFKDRKATITFGRKVSFYRGLMLLCMNISEGKSEANISEKPFTNSNGLQLDLSRNNPLSEESLRLFIRQHALLGLTTVTFYMEDMFDIPDEPYFGYMRGRYAPSVLKELDDYAYAMGVEVVPEIELLAHMEKFLRHYDQAYLRGGSAGELVVGEETTYKFIEKIVKTLSSCLRAKMVHIGLDEARNMNKGPYKEKHGEVPLQDVFFEHAQRVCKIVNDCGMMPILSGDMPFEFCWKGEPPKSACYMQDSVDIAEDVVNSIPENTAVTMWNYAEEDEDTMYRLFNLTRKFTKDVVYMGSARMWQSSVCKFKPTEATIIAGMKAAKRADVKITVFCTWQDSAECPHLLALPTAILAADMEYIGEYSREEMQRKCKFLYGLDYDDFYKMGDADQVHENEEQELATKFLLYNDPLIGLLDYHVKGLDLRRFYGKMVEDYRERGNSKIPAIKRAFDEFKAMLSILELKADFGVRLKKAYDARDKKALSDLADDARIIKARFEKMLEVDRELFTKDFKGFGFETIEMRRATMASRFETTIYKIEKFLSGELDKIEELEEEKLPYNSCPFENETDNIFYAGGLGSIMSVMM